MKKFFQNIKFKKISLTTLALALVVSGFLVWGNKIEAAVSVVNITSPTLYVQSGNSIDINFNVTADSTNVGIVKIEIYGGSGTPSYNTIYQDNNAIDFTNGTASISRNVSIDGVLPEGSYDLKISAQQSGNWVTDEELDLVVVDNTLPVVGTISVNHEAVAEGDLGLGAFVVTVDFSDTNPMDKTTNPTIAFDPTLDTTITDCSNSWTGSTFTYTCNIADADIESADIDIQVIGAKDAAGNTMSGTFTESDKFDVDTIAPTVTATIEPGTGTAKVGDTITATLTAGESQADLNLSGTCTINGVDVTDSFVNNTGGTYTLSYEIGETETDRSSGTLPVSCTLAETSGNTVTLSSFETNTLVVDANSPAAPSITSIATDDKINDSEKGTVVIVGTAEASATINGSLTGAGEPVAVSGTADGSGNFSITVDASGLSDGTLSLSITATDAAGNVSIAGTSSAEKDIVAPTGYSVSFDQDYANDANKAAISFTFADAEMGATYNYSIDDADEAVTGTGIISTTTDQITDINVSTLEDETLTITVTLTDPAGNVGAGVTDTIVKETVAPVISTVTSNATVAGVLKVGDTITFTVTMNATEAGLTIAPTTYNGGTLEWSTAGSGATYTATYTVAEGQTDQGTALQLEGVTATDTFGNTSAAVSGSDITNTIDANKPTGYSVTFDQAYVNNANKAAISFTFAGAEASATYNYSIDDVDNAESTAVTGTGTISTATDPITGIDVSTLDNETLTITVTLTDPAGNAGAGVTDTIVKDIVAPAGYSVAFNEYYVNSSNEESISFTFASAEVGATYNYSIDDTNGDTSAVTGTGTISTSTDQITGIDVSTLDNETLTITVTLTDPAGNVGAEGNNTIVKDTVAPTISTAVVSPNTGTAVIGGTITATLTAGGSQADLTVGVCTINGVDVSGNFTNVGGGTYTITYTVIDGQTDVTAGNLPVSCTLLEPSGNSVAVSAFTDSNTLAVDANSPTVTSITFNDTALKIGDTATVTIVMSEAVTGFDKDDVTAPNGTLGELSTPDGGTTFTGTFTPTASVEDAINEAIVETGFTDVAGNTASAGATSANYEIDTVAPVLPVAGIVGTTIQGAGDQIILTFSEAVNPKDGTWSADEFTSIGDPGAFDLSGASFDATTTGEGYTQLTITLGEDPEDEDTYLWNGNYLTVDPANGAIVDAAGNELSDSAVTGTTAVTGDTVAPTVALTYSPDRSLLGLESVMITATFNELMDETTAPRIAIDTQGDGDLVASTSTAMTKTAPMVWTFDWQVPGGHDDVGIATVSVTGTDLAGNANATASNNTRVITSPDSIITGFTAGSITTTGATLTVTTSENATCKYATEAATFANMIEMGNTGGTTHTQALTGLTEGTKYTNYRVRCSISSNAVSDLEYVEFTTNSVAGNGSFGIISKTMTKMTGAADNTYANGWEWTIRMTLPSDQNSFALKFNDWVSGSNTMAAGGNMEYYSEQISSEVGSSDRPIAITDDNTYPDRVTVLTDVDPNLDGIQTDIHIKVKIPSATPAGSYGTGFQVSYD